MPPENVALVPATEDDLPAVAALINRAYRGSGWSTEAGLIAGDRITTAFLREDLAERAAATLLKWETLQGQLIGCVWLEPLAEGSWYLGSLATDPDLQNGGYGRRLLAAAEVWLRERGAARVRMTVLNVRDTLIAWYLRRGYQPTGETEPFPYETERFGVPLRNDLHFVVIEKRLTRV
jgi:ribosomal protein S18 acetylase RimI-like enzyme